MTKKAKTYTAVVGVNVGDDRYEPGDTVELSAADAKWLLECGAVEEVED